MASIDQYPFLRAALDDITLASDLINNDRGTPRNVVTLLHDALEFILYEVLQMLSEDIYKNGQNTIGLDTAIRVCKSRGVELPLLNTIRSIQKHRGDAKHHAQIPHEQAFSRMVGEFRIIVSRLVHEQFGAALGNEIGTLGLLPYHTALYDSYRKYRTHNWPLALQFALGALLHKHRAVLGTEDDYSGGYRKIPELIGLLGKEVVKASYPPAPADAIDTIKRLPNELQKLVGEDQIAEAAELAGHGYAEVDCVLPGIFDIRTAHRITDLLVVPSGFSFGGSMSWSVSQRGDAQRLHEIQKEVEQLLKTHPDLVKEFGPGHYAQDDDNYWRWWVFAVFDGARWQSFHLNDSYGLSLESGSLTGEARITREVVAGIILEQFRLAVQRRLHLAEPDGASSTETNRID